MKSMHIPSNQKAFGAFFLVTSFISRLFGYLTRKLFRMLHLGRADATSLFFGELQFNGTKQILEMYSKSEVFSHFHVQTKKVEQHLFKERYHVELAECVLDSKSGLAFDTRLSLITDTSSWPVDSLFRSAVPKPLFPYDLPSSNQGFIHLPTSGFYHWLIEDFPPFLKLYNQNPESSLISFNRKPHYVDSITHMLNRELILVPQFVRVKKLHTISRNIDVGWPQKEDIDQLLSFFKELISPETTLEKVYISRLGARRSPYFEKDLIQILFGYGWTILEASNTSLPEQIRIISRADTICGVGGAGLAGQVWMKPGSKVIELAPSRYIPVNSRLASRLGHVYTCINYEEESKKISDLATLIERNS
jgi:hypothetical protein